MSANKPRGPISAVVTTFNDGAMLAEALHSVAGQTLLPQEILVIDDGSEPATAPLVIEKFVAESGLDVTYHWQRNAGPPAARNAGLRQATEEYIAFLDADDLWLPEHLERKLTRLRARDPTYSTAYDGFVEFDHASGRALRTIATGSHDGPIRVELLGMPGGVPAGMQFQLHRRAALQAIGGFDDTLRMGDDFDLLFRLGRADFRITGSDMPTVRRRVHPASITRRDPQRTLEDIEKYLAKAEREALLSADAVASRRKGLWLNVGKQQLINSATVRQGVEMINHAFEFDRPKGFVQWGVSLAARNPALGHAIFGLYGLIEGLRRKMTWHGSRR